MPDASENDRRDDGRVDRRSLLKYGGSGAVAVGLAGCQSPQNPYPGSGLRADSDEESKSESSDLEEPLSGETVRLGILAPLDLPLGRSMRDGARLAAKQLQNDGGIKGADVEVVVGDTNAEPGEAVSQHKRLVNQENCDITMGIFLGSALVQTMPSIGALETIHITTASADPRAGRVVSKTNTFSNSTGEEEYEQFKYHFRAGPINLFDLADAMLEFVENKKDDLDWERIAVLTENPQEFTPYHEQLVASLDEIVDVPIVQRVGGVADWSPFYNDIENENCDVALVGLALDGASAVNQWADQRRDFEFGGIHVPSQSYGFWASTAGNTRHVFTMNAMTPQTNNTELTQPFVEAYNEEFDDVPIYSGAITYDAVNIVEQAITRAVENEGVEGEIPGPETLIPILEEGTFGGSTILDEFQFTPPDAEYAHEPQWTSIEGTGVPVFQQWQFDPEVTEDYGTMHSFYPEENKTADYTVPDWIGGGN